MIQVLTLASAGVVLFLFGMLRLSHVIQRLFTDRIRTYIRYAVQRPFWGLLTGIVATILFQSSSATTVIAVGMVSAGLVSFYNALAVILGADVGTTVIVQLVVWKVGDLSPLFLVIGGILWTTAGQPGQTVGQALIYFWLLFFGLSLVGMAAAPLRDHPRIIAFFQEPGHPVVTFLASAAFTAVVQASAIPISMMVILGQYDLVSLENAVPVVLGANVGTAATALLAGAVADVGGRRVALSHFLFKAIGAVLWLAASPLIPSLLRGLSDNLAQQIAYSHFLFNLFIVAVFFFLLKPFARMVERLVPGESDVLPLWPEFLQERLLDNPGAALDGVHRELERSIALAQRVYRLAIPLREAYGEEIRRKVLYVEMVIDHLRREIVAYLRRLSCRPLSPLLSRDLFVYTAIADDIERMSDHIVGLVDLSRTKALGQIGFSRAAEEELEEIERLVGLNLDDAVTLVCSPAGGQARRADVTRREEEIDVAVRQARDRHLVRFHEGLCRAEAGPVFLEMLIHLERISDHCQNIADYMGELEGRP